MRCCWLVTTCLLLASGELKAVEPAVPKKIVLIAGPITGHGKHTHEYEKSVILLKHLLDTSPSTKGKVAVETHFKGWPTDEKTLDDAATIVMISDGGDRNVTDHPLYVGERFQTLERQMKPRLRLRSISLDHVQPQPSSRSDHRMGRWLFRLRKGTRGEQMVLGNQHLGRERDARQRRAPGHSRREAIHRSRRVLFQPPLP